MTEFTGERVIPGAVNDDLWNEHLARYAFARLHASGKRVLDAGCGTGYGSAELAQVSHSVVGLDIAPQAVEFARKTYPLEQLHFLVSSCSAIPFANNTFDLVVAFELIEHLTDHRSFLLECGRVIAHQGLLLISSPNKSYYAESRASTPNPYHEHEFEPAEFVDELKRVFSNVRLLLQNHVESFAFHPAAGFWPTEARIDAGGGTAEDANFLLALCSFGPLPDPRSFVYVPKAANILREREQHIALLEEQLAKKNRWLAETQAERDSLLDLYRKQTAELEERQQWALQLAGELENKTQRVVQLQEEFAAEQRAATGMAAAYEANLRELEAESQDRLEWGRATEARLTAELDAKMRELAECVRLLENAEATVVERTHWAQRTEALREQLAAQLNMVRASRWLKLGRKVGLGPVIDPPGNSQ